MACGKHPKLDYFASLPPFLAENLPQTGQIWEENKIDLKSFFEKADFNYSKLWMFLTRTGQNNYWSDLNFILDRIFEEDAAGQISSTKLADLLIVCTPPTVEWIEFFQKKIQSIQSSVGRETIFWTVIGLQSPEKSLEWVKKQFFATTNQQKKNLLVYWSQLTFYSDLKFQDKIDFLDQIFLKPQEKFTSCELSDFLEYFKELPCQQEVPQSIIQYYSPAKKQSSSFRENLFRFLFGGQDLFCNPFCVKSIMDRELFAKVCWAYYRGQGDFSKIKIDAVYDRADMLNFLTGTNVLNSKQKKLLLQEFQKIFLRDPSQNQELQKELVENINWNADLAQFFFLENPEQEHLLKIIKRKTNEPGHENSSNSYFVRKAKLLCVKALLLEKKGKFEAAKLTAQTAVELCIRKNSHDDSFSADFAGFYQDFLPKFPLLKQVFLDCWDKTPPSQMPDAQTFLGIAANLPEADAAQILALSQKSVPVNNYHGFLFRELYKSPKMTENYLTQLEKKPIEANIWRQELLTKSFIFPSKLPRGKKGLLSSLEHNRRLGKFLLELPNILDAKQDDEIRYLLSLTLQPEQYKKLVLACQNENYPQEMIRFLAKIKKRIILNKNSLDEEKEEMLF